MNQEILSCHNIHKHYNFSNESSRTEILTVLNNISLQIKQGEIVSIVGSSGSGKTSLLQILAGLDQADSGIICFNGHDITKLPHSEKDSLRNKNFGFIYQFHHLLPEFTVLENIMMPIIIGRKNNNKTSKKNYYEKAQYLLSKLNLFKKDNYFPGQLSGGEKQRVAIIRALINNPTVVFADEPTGNLDNNTARQVIDLFFQLQQELNMAVLLVTHDTIIAKRTENIFNLHNGQLQQLN